MSDFYLGKRSLKRLEGVQCELIAIVKQAILITAVDFTVLEGLRTRKRQMELVAAGASQTMNSRHLTGHAVDLGAWVGKTVAWDWPLYHRIASAMKAAAEITGIACMDGLEWGGDWKSFPDGPHFQLSWNMYPP